VKPFPISQQSPLVRTFFRDDSAWNAVCESASQLPPSIGSFMGILAGVNSHLGDTFGDDTGDIPSACAIVNDIDYADIDTTELWQSAASIGAWPVLFVFDEHASASPDHAILVIDLQHDPGRTFRTTPDQLYWIESNLSISNCEWEDFANSLGPDGVFRGMD
jgi:hypothetical protein